MTLNTHRRRDLKRTRRTRVWLDGVEVTRRCFYADKRRGVVRLYRETADGQFFLGQDGIETEERRGKVRWGRIS